MTMVPLVVLSTDVKKVVTVQEVTEAPVFKNWFAQLSQEHQKAQITVTHADVWGGEVHSLHVVIADEPRPVHAIIRNDTVDVLVVLRWGSVNRFVMTKQYRPAIGRRVTANVAGGIKAGQTLLQAAEAELREELGFENSKLPAHSLVALTRAGFYASPGMISEKKHLFLATFDFESLGTLEEFANALNGKQTGVASEGEEIVVRVLELDDLKRLMGRDCDATLSLSLLLAGHI